MHPVVSSLSHPYLVHCSSPSCSSPPAPICSPASRATHSRIVSSPALRANDCPIATRSSALGMKESEFSTARGGRGASKEKETPEVGATMSRRSLGGRRKQRREGGSGSGAKEKLRRREDGAGAGV
ncbi:hypothetical protein TIFTF001_015665 [Ficus carica]|uniref:Uncharacterized protein n=1 Tax=Ficus carica TaxID=3494 RepID=A0AA88A4W4_FICCA|nr:hypothetical protein TIFTF001_015665 [Ficus carica]